MSALDQAAPWRSRARSRASYPIRVGVVAALVVTALVAQLSVAAALGTVGLFPNLVLLVVVAGAVARGRDFGAGLGFALGLALDLGPASDHLAGRWALAFVVAGYLAGSTFRSHPGSRPRRLVLVLLSAAASFVATSVFALTGLLLSDPATSLPAVLEVIITASLTDGALALLLVPLLVGAFDRLTPAKDH